MPKLSEIQMDDVTLVDLVEFVERIHPAIMKAVLKQLLKNAVSESINESIDLTKVNP